MIGLNEKILCQYIEYITNQRMAAIGLPAIFDQKSNPLPWMQAWISSDNVQTAPQESEISSYLTGALDSNIEEDAFMDVEL